MAVYVPPEINDAVTNCEYINEPDDEPDGVLNGLPFAPWQTVPTTAQGWNDSAPSIEKPVRPNDCNAVGAVIVEPDGRAWVVAPTNQHGDKHNTFPTGRIRTDAGLSAHASACLEAYEKTGLQIRLNHQLVDIDNGSATTRYYLAERIGGTPADAGWKSQAVKLVPMKILPRLFADDGAHSHNHEHTIVESLKHSMLNKRLNASQKLGESIEAMRKWIHYLAPLLPSNPKFFEEGNSTMALNFNLAAYALSEQLNLVVENWRKENFSLIDNVVTRPNSAPLRAATMLKAPRGSAESYLHANRIQTDGCGIAFIAAQRPQTILVPQRSGNNVSKLILGISSSSSSQPQARAAVQAVVQTDNSTTFWQTVLNENVNLIVDLDDIKATPREMPYGPQENAEKGIGTHTLTLTAAQQMHRDLRVEQIEARDANNPAKDVLRLHYTAWPDGGVIKPQALIDLARDVVLQSRASGTTVLVHSTRGVGRTGTLITFIAASEKIAALLQKQPTMPLKTFITIVMNLVIGGRLERGPGFVNGTQVPLLFAALLEKHFVGVKGNYGAQDVDLVRR